MKKIAFYFIPAILFSFMFSCEPEMIDPFEHFLLPQGKHSQKIRVEALQTTSINFDALFDQSAIYESETIENQHDINKLMGFSDCNSTHHVNSARFGWRWLDGKLEIHAYAYVQGDRITEYIGCVDLDVPNNYELRISDDAYHFYLQGHDEIAIARKNGCDRGLYYMLYPYFGGDEVAPHDISIKIKMNY